MLTEDQIHRSFRRLVDGAEITGDTVEKAESLIEQLRWESPLRHRLTCELDELRDLCSTKD
ncbi:MAG: hypothetical protein KDA60_07515 [Planctomycetales bacterium]|nr:hypothetical protein [Planctomycetales bacterium]